MKVCGEVAQVLEHMLGSGVCVLAEAIQKRPLYPLEEQYVIGAAANRIAEFSCGRYLARKALATIGIQPQEIPIGRLREPIWPEGSVGSITHSSGLCAVAVTKTPTFLAIGIDILNIDEASLVMEQAAAFIMGSKDVVHAQGWRAHPAVLLFGAKESTIKVTSKYHARFLDFVEVEMKIEGESFSSGSIQGSWREVGGLLVTAAVQTIP